MAVKHFWRVIDDASSGKLLVDILSTLMEQRFIAPQPVESFLRLLSGAMNETAMWLAGTRSMFLVQGDRSAELNSCGLWGSEEPALLGSDEGFRRRGDIEFTVNRFQVGLERIDGNKQRLGDDRAGVPHG